MHEKQNYGFAWSVLPLKEMVTDTVPVSKICILIFNIHIHSNNVICELNLFPTVTMQPYILCCPFFALVVNTSIGYWILKPAWEYFFIRPSWCITQCICTVYNLYSLHSQMRRTSRSLACECKLTSKRLVFLSGCSRQGSECVCVFLDCF